MTCSSVPSMSDSLVFASYDKTLEKMWHRRCSLLAHTTGFSYSSQIHLLIEQSHLSYHEDGPSLCTEFSPPLVTCPLPSASEVNPPQVTYHAFPPPYKLAIRTSYLDCANSGSGTRQRIYRKLLRCYVRNIKTHWHF